MRWRLAVLSFMTLFFLMACQRGGLGGLSDAEEDVNHLQGVSLEFKEETYQAEGDHFELRVINESSDKISYGMDYQVEYLQDGSWMEVEPNDSVYFNMIAQVLDVGEEQIEEINFQFYEPFEEGEYRLVREIEEEILTAGFEIIEGLFSE